MKRVKLKNAEGEVLLDDHVYEWLIAHPRLAQDDFLNNLRKHSSGCAVFQKTRKLRKGEYKTETIYLHKLIAEHFLEEQRSDDENLVGARNGNKLDCRLSNLIYRSRSTASRMRRTNNRSGFTGVYQENNRYRAVISIDGKSHHLGMFATPEEAAQAYNTKSQEAFGPEGKINEV